MPEDETFVPRFPYREVVGALMYIVTYTRPDTSFAVGEVLKYLKRHNKSHLAAAKRVLKYLKTTQDQGHVFGGDDKGNHIGYADAN